MTGKWRLLISAVVCLVAIASAFHFLVMERYGVPDSGIRVRQFSADESGKDWVISLYEEQDRRRDDCQRPGKHTEAQLRIVGFLDFLQLVCRQVTDVLGRFLLLVVFAHVPTTF